MAVAQQPKAGPLDFMKGHKIGLGTPAYIKSQIEAWSATQSPWVDALTSTTLGGAQGSLLGLLMGTMSRMSAGAAGAGAAPQMMALGTPAQQARNFAVMSGLNAGINTLMKRLRGKEDVQNSLVAAFGSGACFSLISGLGKPGGGPGTGSANPLMAAFSTGVVFALFQGAFFKFGERFSSPKTQDTDYVRVRAMLASLGLSKYEGNVKKGLLDDRTIALWDSSSLAEVRIPPGPRLLILDHIDQYRHILKPAGPLPSSQ